MNKYIKTAILLLVFSPVFAQNVVQKPFDLLVPTKKWILTNNRIENNEIYLTAYKTSKLKANTFVMSFLADGKIEYDYETNFAFKSDTRIQFLDLVPNQCLWEQDSLSDQISLTIKGGYSSLDDFKFKRIYAIERIADGYILRKTEELYFDDLKLMAVSEKKRLAQIKKDEILAQQRQQILDRQNTIQLAPKVEVVSNNVQIVQEQKLIKSDSLTLQVPTNQVVISELSTQNISIPVAETKLTPIVEEKIIPVAVIDYVARTRELFDNSKRWMLVKNKIEKNDIFLTTYNESKLTINNLVLTLAGGRIVYDYESDPKIRFCAGVDFLDIDTDETSWTYDSEKNIVTLTLKGGYASLDDFKFKRDYWVEIIDDGYVLRKLKEHYFDDFRKPITKNTVTTPKKYKKTTRR